MLNTRTKTMPYFSTKFFERHNVEETKFEIPSYNNAEERKQAFLKLCDEIMDLEEMPDSVKNKKNGIPKLKSNINNTALLDPHHFSVTSESFEQLYTINELLKEFQKNNKLASIASQLDQFMDFARCAGGNNNDIQSWLMFLQNQKAIASATALAKFQIKKQEVIEAIIGAKQKNIYHKDTHKLLKKVGHSYKDEQGHTIQYRDVVMFGQGMEIHADKKFKYELKSEYGLNTDISMFHSDVLSDYGQAYPLIKRDIQQHIEGKEFVKEYVNAIANDIDSNLENGVIHGAINLKALEIGVEKYLYKNSKADEMNVNMLQIKRLYAIQELNKEGMLNNEDMQMLANPSVALFVARLGQDLYNENDEIAVSAYKLTNEFITFSELTTALTDIQVINRLNQDPELCILYQNILAENRACLHKVMSYSSSQCEQLAKQILAYEGRIGNNHTSQEYFLTPMVQEKFGEIANHIHNIKIVNTTFIDSVVRFFKWLIGRAQASLTVTQEAIGSFEEMFYMNELISLKSFQDLMITISAGEVFQENAAVNSDIITELSSIKTSFPVNETLYKHINNIIQDTKTSFDAKLSAIEEALSAVDTNTLSKIQKTHHTKANDALDRIKNLKNIKGLCALPEFGVSLHSMTFEGIEGEKKRKIIEIAKAFNVYDPNAAIQEESLSLSQVQIDSINNVEGGLTEEEQPLVVNEINSAILKYKEACDAQKPTHDYFNTHLKNFADLDKNNKIKHLKELADKALDQDLKDKITKRIGMYETPLQSAYVKTHDPLKIEPSNTLPANYLKRLLKDEKLEALREEVIQYIAQEQGQEYDQLTDEARSEIKSKNDFEEKVTDKVSQKELTMGDIDFNNKVNLESKTLPYNGREIVAFWNAICNVSDEKQKQAVIDQMQKIKGEVKNSQNPGFKAFVNKKMDDAINKLGGRSKTHVGTHSGKGINHAL